MDEAFGDNCQLSYSQPYFHGSTGLPQLAETGYSELSRPTVGY